MKVSRYVILPIIAGGLITLMMLYGCNRNASPIDFSAPSTLQGTLLSTQTLVTPSISTLTSMPLPTIIETSTPIPKLPPAEAQEAIMNLLKTNAGCQFPCWWGFVPGETSWLDVERTVTPLALQIYLSKSNNNPIQVGYVKFLVPKEVWETAIDHIYTIRSGIVDAIEIEVVNVEWYTLSKLLSTYGKPTEIWLRTYNKARENDLPFDTLLFYADRQMIMRFYSQGNQQGVLIQGCPQQHPVAMLFFWSGNNNWNFLEATAHTVNLKNEEWWPYLPLQDVTQMTIDEFYAIFSNSQNSKCIETSSEYWPSP